MAVAAAGTACGGPEQKGLPACGLRVESPGWVLEGTSVRIPIVCAGGEAPADLAVHGLPDGARWSADAGAVEWRTSLSDAGVYEVEARLPTGETAHGRLGVVDAWDAPGNVRPDPARYTEEYGLPVVHLDHAQAISSAAYVPATLTYRGKRYDIEAKHRGSRSLEFPKKSFTLSFPSVPFADAALGVSGRKKMVLVTTFDDQTHVRNRLAIELWKRLAPGRFAVRTASAVLYENGAFRGVYMLSEKLGGQVLSAGGLNGDGNLYQGKTHAANFAATLPDGSPKATWHDGYEKDEGTPLEGQPGAFDDLDALVSFVATASDSAFAAQLPGLLDVDEFRDWWVLVMLAFSGDTAGKNGMLYHDPLGGPWRTTVWDWGASLGQDWQTLRTSAREPGTFGGANRLFARLLAPPFGDGTRDRLRAAVEERVPVADVLALFDAMADETAAAAARDDARWGETQRAFFGAEGRTGWARPQDEVAYTRRWIQDRWAWIASQR